MTWYDVDDILIDGSREEIEKVMCPECGGKLQYSYAKGGKTGGTLRIFCKSCGIMEVLHKLIDEPNCIKLV